MGYRLFRDQNTVVLEQGTVVIELPIVDSYFTYNITASSYEIKTVLSRKTASIPRADIGTYSNELGVLYTEETLLSFLRLYCSLTDKIPESILPPNFPTLPSGTYTPKNTVGGPFDLLWESQTGNVITGDSEIEKTSGSGAWDGSGIARVIHNGDFSLKFKVVYTSESPVLCRFGISYWKYSNDTINLDFAFYRSGSSFAIVENGGNSFLGGISVDDLTEFKIDRVADEVLYYVNNVLQYTTSNISTGNFNIDCTIFSLCKVSDIELIIP